MNHVCLVLYILLSASFLVPTRDFIYLKRVLSVVAPPLVDLPRDHSVSKIDKKILISCGTRERASKNMYVVYR